MIIYSEVLYKVFKLGVVAVNLQGWEFGFQINGFFSGEVLGLRFDFCFILWMENRERIAISLRVDFGQKLGFIKGQRVGGSLIGDVFRVDKVSQKQVVVEIEICVYKYYLQGFFSNLVCILVFFQVWGD